MTTLSVYFLQNSPMLHSLGSSEGLAMKRIGTPDMVPSYFAGLSRFPNGYHLVLFG